MKHTCFDCKYRCDRCKKNDGTRKVIVDVIAAFITATMLWVVLDSFGIFWGYWQTVGVVFLTYQVFTLIRGVSR